MGEGNTTGKGGKTNKGRQKTKSRRRRGCNDKENVKKERRKRVKMIQKWNQLRAKKKNEKKQRQHRKRGKGDRRN